MGLLIYFMIVFVAGIIVLPEYVQSEESRKRTASQAGLDQRPLDTFTRLTLRVINPTEQSPDVKIASFNIQDLGLRKLTESRSWVSRTLYRIFCQYDVVFVMEMTTAMVLETFHMGLNEYARNNYNSGVCRNYYFNSFGSNPHGPENCAAAQEIYAYFVAPQRPIYLENWHDYNGNYKDEFIRPPFITTLQIVTRREIARESILYQRNLAAEKFLLIGMHAQAKRGETERELNALVDMYEEEYKSNFPNAIMMGDFNADCSYIGQRTYNSLKITQQDGFQWLIDPTTKTNVLETCSYDKFVAVGDKVERCLVQGSATVSSYFPIIRQELSLDPNTPVECEEALKKIISDHYPIEMTLRIGNCV